MKNQIRIRLFATLGGASIAIGVLLMYFFIQISNQRISVTVNETLILMLGAICIGVGIFAVMNSFKEN